VTQVGDGPRADKTALAATAGPGFAPTTGDLLADRYRLEEHINNDSAGRQVWRGVDVLLRRPVALVLRYPGGDSAHEMLEAAVTASRVNHSNLIGVYDAVDEGFRAFVVREWIDGSALRDLVAAEGHLDAERTTAVLNAVASAVAALHASGMAHGNIHPGTILAGHDGRVVLTDARADMTNSPEGDVRALGAAGYFMLTGSWPSEGGRAPATLLDGRRDSAGVLVAPRLIRAGVPNYLDDLIMDLLNPDLPLPTSAVLAAELARLDTGDPLFFGTSGTLGFADEQAAEEPPRTPTPRLVAIGGTALALVIAGLVLGVKALTANADPRDPGPQVTSSAPVGNDPRQLPLAPAQVRIVDPKGDRAETKDAFKLVDGDTGTVWKTNGYARADFGGAKAGMGILISLDKVTNVASVKVQVNLAGATAELRTGLATAEDSSAGDATIIDTYTIVGSPQANAGTTIVFPAGVETQYLLVWFTNLPLDGSSTSQFPYKITVQEIVVEVQ
jgi:hypothetical protein